MSLGHLPVITVSVQQGFAIETKVGLIVRVVAMRLFIQGHKESSTLDDV